MQWPAAQVPLQADSHGLPVEPPPAEPPEDPDPGLEPPLLPDEPSLEDVRAPPQLDAMNALEAAAATAIVAASDFTTAPRWPPG